MSSPATPKEFLAEWCGENGVYALGAISSEGDQRKWLTTRSADDAAAFVETYAERGFNLYFQPNVVRPDLGGARAARADVIASVAAYVEIDPPKEISTPEALEEWQVSTAESLHAWTHPDIPRPTTALFSGSGFVLLWRLETALTGPLASDIEARNRWLVPRLNGDPASTDSSRLLRLPWTMNHPSEKKRAAGRLGPELAELLWSSEERVPVAAFGRNERAPSSEPRRVEYAEVPPLEARDRAAAILREAWPSSNRHRAQLALAGGLANAGWPEAACIDFLTDVAGDEAKRAETVRHTLAALENGEAITGWPALAELVGDGPVTAARAALGFAPPPPTDEVDEEYYASLTAPEPPPRPAPEPAEEVYLDEFRALVKDASKKSNRLLSMTDKIYLEKCLKGLPLTDQPGEDPKIALRRAVAAIAKVCPEGVTNETASVLLAKSAPDVASDAAIRLVAEARALVVRAPQGHEDFGIETQGANAGRPRKDDLRNWKIALGRLGAVFRYDQFAYRNMLCRGGKTVVVEDEHVDGLRFEIEEEFGFRPPENDWYKFCDNQGFRAAFHPVKDYFDSLPEWDGIPRLENWLSTYAGVPDSEYVRAVSRLVVVAMVRRIRNPGDKFDEMLVLFGAQGKEKSSVLKALMPIKTWFSDNLNMAEDTQKIMEQTAGKLLIEIPEMKNSSKFDERTNKSILSRDTDESRMAYGRKTATRPRQFVVCGSTNKREFLKDSTGNRRYWPVIVGAISVVGMERERDLLWTEAVYLESTGMPIRLDPSLYAAAAAEQERFRFHDPIQVRLGNLLQQVQGSINIEDVWKVLGHQDDKLPSENEQSRIIDALQSMGFDRVDGSSALYARGEDTERGLRIEISGHSPKWNVRQRGSAPMLAPPPEATEGN